MQSLDADKTKRWDAVKWSWEDLARIKLLCLEALLFEFTLFAEDATAHLKDGLESFTANLRIFTETIHARLLDLVLDLLPSTAKSGDLGFLAEVRSSGWVEGGLPIGNGLAHAENV